MSRREPSERSFLRDVKDHVMDIRRDDGLYRSIRFQRPGSWAYGFDITTWPGYLCFSGDMGCYVFARIPDMLDFFRGQRPYIKGDKVVGINPGYWSEKVQAADRCSGIEEFSPKEFRRIINRVIYSGGWPKPVRDAVKDDVLAAADDGEWFAKHAAYEFGMTHEGRRYDFQDFWEYGDCKVYTHRFLWACYAIAWSVQKYDDAKSAIAGEGDAA